MRKIYNLSLILFLFFFSTIITSAYTIPSSDWSYQIGNVYYNVSSTMDFTDIYRSDSWIQFNKTRINVSSENDINVTLNYLADTTDNNIELLNISVNTSEGNVIINISGLKVNSRHRVTMNGTTLLSTTSDNTGLITFSNYDWSVKYFQVYSDYEISAPEVDESSTPIDKSKTTEPFSPMLLLIMIILFIMVVFVGYLIFTD